MSWFAFTSTPLAAVVMLVSGLSAIYFRQHIAAWLFKQDSSHVSRDEKYAETLRQSFAYWPIGIGIFLILNALLNITGPLKLGRQPPPTPPGLASIRSWPDART
jgi:hypothetical protein